MNRRAVLKTNDLTLQCASRHLPLNILTFVIYVFYYQNKCTSATEQSSTFPMTRFHAYTWYSLTPDIHGGVIFAVCTWTCCCTFVKQWDGFNPLWSKGSRGKGFLKGQKYWIHNIRSSFNDPYMSHTTYCWFCSKVIVVSVRDFILRFSYFRNGTWMFQVHFSSLGKIQVCASNWGFFVFPHHKLISSSDTPVTKSSRCAKTLQQL